MYAYLIITGMGKVESQTKDQKRIIIQKSKICNYGRARYLYENAVAREPGYTLSRSFQNSINYQLPLRYNERAYMEFIDNWGTVAILSLTGKCYNPQRGFTVFSIAAYHLDSGCRNKRDTTVIIKLQ